MSMAHTAVTRETLDCMLHREIPFLSKLGSPGVVEQSDGASNFTCKDAVRANYLNPHVVCVAPSFHRDRRNAHPQRFACRCRA